VGRGLVASEATRNLALNPALRGIQQRRIDRRDDRALDGGQLAREVLRAAHDSLKAGAAQLIGRAALEPADPARVAAGPGQINADEGERRRRHARR